MAFYGWPSVSCGEDNDNDLITVVIDSTWSSSPQQAAFGFRTRRDFASGISTAATVHAKCRSCTDLPDHTLDVSQGKQKLCPEHQQQPPPDPSGNELGPDQPRHADDTHAKAGRQGQVITSSPLSKSCGSLHPALNSTMAGMQAMVLSASAPVDMGPLTAVATYHQAQPTEHRANDLGRTSLDSHREQEGARDGAWSGEESEEGLASHAIWWGSRPVDSSTNAEAGTGEARGIWGPLANLVPSLARPSVPAWAGDMTPHTSTATWSSTESSADSSTDDVTANDDSVGTSGRLALLRTSAGHRARRAHAAAGAAGMAGAESPVGALTGSASGLFQASQGSDEGSSTTEHSSGAGDASSMDSSHKGWRRRQQRVLAEQLAARRHSGSMQPTSPTSGQLHRAASLHAVPDAGRPELRRMASLQTMAGARPGTAATLHARDAVPRFETFVPSARAVPLTEGVLLMSRASIRENARGPRMQRWLLDSVSSTRPAPSKQGPVSPFSWATQLHWLSRSLRRRCTWALQGAGTQLARAQASVQYLGRSSAGTVRALGTRILLTVGGGCVARRKAVELVSGLHYPEAPGTMRHVSAGTREAAARQLAAMDAAAATTAGAASRTGIPDSQQPPPLARQSLPSARQTQMFARQSQPLPQRSLWTDSSEEPEDISSEEDEEGSDDSSDACSGAYAHLLPARNSYHSVPSADDAPGSRMLLGSGNWGSFRHTGGLPVPGHEPGSVSGAGHEEDAAAFFSVLALDAATIARLAAPTPTTAEATTLRSLTHVLHEDERMHVKALTLPAGFRVRGSRPGPRSCTLHVLKGSVTVSLTPPPGAAASPSAPAPVTEQGPEAVQPATLAPEPEQGLQQAVQPDSLASGAGVGTGAGAREQLAVPAAPTQAVQSVSLTGPGQEPEGGDAAPILLEPVDQQAPPSATNMQIDQAAAASPVHLTEGAPVAHDQLENSDMGLAATGASEELVAASIQCVEQPVPPVEPCVLRLQDGSMVTVAPGAQYSLNANTFATAVVLVMVIKP